MKIIWTKHAEDRQREWEKKLGITRKQVEDLLKNPDQIVLGDRGAFIAQTKIRNGLLRSCFIDVGGGRKVLTVYWTSRVERYWKEEKG